MQGKFAFDFDGTLVRVNTFPFWVLYLLLLSILTLRWGIFLDIFTGLFKRKFGGGMSHSDFKMSLIRLSVPPAWNMIFAFLLKPLINSRVWKEMLTLSSGGGAILVTTAAPLSYIKYVFRDLVGRENFFLAATKFESGIFFDNYKCNKVVSAAALGFLGGSGGISILFTDSWDDRALAGFADLTLLVEVSDSDYRKFLSDETLAGKIKKY